MAKKWILEEGSIYAERGGVLYDCLDDWCSSEGQQVLCDLLNEGHDNKSWEEIEPLWEKRMAEKAAPDLLKACEQVLKLIKCHQAYDKDAQSILEMAIAKAKGEG